MQKAATWYVDKVLGRTGLSCSEQQVHPWFDLEVRNSQHFLSGIEYIRVRRDEILGDCYEAGG